MYTGFDDSTVLFDIITCDQFLVGSSGALQVEYSQGGVPRVFVQQSQMNGTGLCGYPGTNTTTFQGAKTSSGAVGGRSLNGLGRGVVSAVALAVSAVMLLL